MLEDAAERERNTKRYRDRTYTAVTSTVAEGTQGGDPSVFVLQMGADYSSTLVDKGLSDFEEIAEQAAEEIEEELNNA